jgi:very-long-chain (3R)-3-hydroxyacyl-CoA dehydratase
MWCWTLFIAVRHLVETQHWSGMFPVVSTVLYWAQTAAILEVFHSLVGLVRSGWFSTAMQVSSRLFLVWAVTYFVQDARDSRGFPLMVVSWSLVEIPRYSFYLVKLVWGDAGMPAALKWLRYSLFAVLYPSGITGELLCIVASLPSVAKLHMGEWLVMPNAINFEVTYYGLLRLVLVFYVPCAPFLYMHMQKLRKKQLAAPTAAKKSS